MRGEPGPRDGKEEMVSGTGTRAKTETRTRRKTRHEDRDGGKNGSWNRDENREEGGGERWPKNLRSGRRGGSENARDRTTPTINHQPRSQDSMPQ